MKTINKPGKVWYLELDNPISKPVDHAIISIQMQENIDLDDYLKKYRQIGDKWGWSNRLIITKNKLESILSNHRSEIYYAYTKNSFIGYYELNLKQKNIEIVYFGLTPEKIGKGLGKILMYDAQQKALLHNPDRIWLHTCEFDSPHALKFYQNTGFKIFDEKIEDQIIIIH